MFVACGMWCVADVSSVSASSEQTRKCSWFEFERKTTYSEFFFAVSRPASATA